MSQKGGRGGKGKARSEAGAGVVNIGPAPGSIESAIQLGREAGFDVKLMSEAEGMARVKSSFMAFFSPRDKTIYLNSSIFGKGNLVAEIKAKGYQSGFYSSGHPDTTIYHEIGHAKHFEAIKNRMYSKRGRRWNDLSRAKVPKQIAWRVGREVSGYASTNKLEFVAEVYAGVASGKRYSPRIMKYYKALGGQ